MVGFDAAMLLLLLRPDAGAPLDPQTGKPVEFVEERISRLITQLEKRKTQIVIPTPALSEVLVRAGAAAAEYVNTINSMTVFRIAGVPIKGERLAREICEESRPTGQNPS